MKLLAGPLDAVADLCATHAPSHVVSWLSPAAAAPEALEAFAPEARLVLRSHDIAAPAYGLKAPCLDQVAELLAFAAAWPGERPLLAHCWAGVSRSTAAAFAIACLKRPDMPEAELARRVRALSPMATPNPLIVRLADELLQRDGRMVAANSAIGRGAETALGNAFELGLS